MNSLHVGDEELTTLYTPAYVIAQDSSLPRSFFAGTCLWCRAGTYSPAESSTCISCSAGSFSATNASSCQLCGNGTWSALNASTCVQCKPGQYSETIGATSNGTCLQCPNGTASNQSGVGLQERCLWCSAGLYATAGSTACLICPNLTYSGLQASLCLGCPAFSDSPAGSSLDKCVCRGGYFQNSTVQPFMCQPCLLGTYQNSVDRAVCLPCPAGFYGVSSRATSLSTGCSKCLAGTYSAAGATACRLCPAGNFSSANASSTCPQCPMGTWGLSGASACTSCPSGTFSNTTQGASLAVCTPCPAGTYSTRTGASSINLCYSCPAGSSSETGAQSCSGCPANTFSNPETKQCTNCPPYSSSGDASVMNGCVCDPGYMYFYRSRAVGGYEIYQPDVIRGTVYRAHRFYPSGSIQILKDTLIVFVCDGAALYRTTVPEGVYQVPEDFLTQASVGVCKTSAAIQYDVNGAFDAAESPIYFKCVACPTGQYSVGGGQESCSTCIAGTYQSSAGGTACLDCDISFVSDDGASSCSGCPVGQYQANAKTCRQCPAGTSSGPAPSAQCTTCGVTTWASAGSESCTPCPVYSYGPGGTDVQGCRCAGGTYMFVASDYAACLLCTAGTFSNEGATDCTVCPSGTISDYIAATSCTPCPNGYFTDGQGATACNACPSGFIPTVNKDGCQECPMGYFCQPDGTMTSCPLGSIGNGTGMTSVDQCILCPPNSVCPNGQTVQACPPNTHSDPGSTAVTDCVCDVGYSCAYTKILNAVVELPMTPDQFALLAPEFIRAVAEAAGVDPSNVVINSVQSVPARRSLQRRRGGVKIQIMLSGAKSLRWLDQRLRRHGLPHSLRKTIIKREHVHRVVALPLA